jgi:hypothetical protein
VIEDRKQEGVEGSEVVEDQTHRKPAAGRDHTSRGSRVAAVRERCERREDDPQRSRL